MKKGFTLVELLVVIAIIGILTLIAVPNVIKISKNSDSRLYAQKKENIVAAAELYASNNPDIFQGSDVVNIPVYILLNEGYLTADLNYNEKECNGDSGLDAIKINSGCITNPTDKENPIINDRYVTVTKKTAGVVGEFNDGSNSEYLSSEETLVGKVCEGFENGSFAGKFGTGENDYCHCTAETTGGETIRKLVKINSSEEVNQCIIVSNKESGEVNNWLKYGSSDEPNWRVLGLYKIDNKINAKMITSKIIE